MTAKALLIALVVAYHASVMHAQSSTERLRTFVSAYSHDSTQGRLTGSAAAAQLTTALGDSLAALGLQPLGAKGSFLQDVPLMRVSINPQAMLLASTRPVFSYQFGVDYMPLVGIGGLPFGRRSRGEEFVFGGRLGTSSAIVPSKAIGKIVVMEPPVRADGRADYQIWNYPQFFTPYRNSKAILVISLELMPASVRQSLLRPHFELRQKQNPDPPMPPVAVLSDAAALMLLGKTPEQALASRDTVRNLVSLAFDVHEEAPRAPTRNVVAVIEGADPELKAQFVVLSARLDQADFRERETGMRRSWPLAGDTTQNGADAITGAATLFEIARSLVTSTAKPRRSIVFLWTIGADDGGIGSDFFVNSGLIPRDKIVADINVDHVGRGDISDHGKGGPQYLEVTGARRLSSNLGDWIDDVNRASVAPFALDTQFDISGTAIGHYCNGDQWSFARHGIPSVLITTGTHADYRTVGDQVDKIDFDKLARVSDFVGALAVDIANKPKRPALDQPKPDPGARCIQ